MKIFEALAFNVPFIRVNNRDENIAFYRDSLGLRLISEENAIALFSAYDNPKEKIIIEESPATRTRKVVDDQKKLKQVRIKCQKASDIESLLARGAAYTKLYQGENGYAFETKSPENDFFLLHAETNLSSLREIEPIDFKLSDDFKGLSDFEIDQITLRVKDNKAERFYEEIFNNQLPLNLVFSIEDGEDLTVSPNETWDLEILEFQVAKEQSLKELKAYFESKDLPVYLDKSEKILVISDDSKIELWFVK